MDFSIVKRNNVYQSDPAKQAMIFAHGFGCDQNMWRLVAPAFENDYNVILFDYVGSGKSDLTQYDPQRYSQIEGYAQDLIDVCNSLEVRHAIFVGHSVSSMIGLVAAINNPALFDRMVMIGPSPRYINDEDYIGGFDRMDISGLFETMDRNYIGWANFMAPVIMGNAERPELGAELAESFCSTDPVIARQFAEVTFYSDNRKDLSRLKVPCLILQCDEDVIAPEAVGRYVSAHIPNNQFIQLNAKGHCPQLSAPAETIQAIKTYLSGPAE